MVRWVEGKILDKLIEHWEYDQNFKGVRTQWMATIFRFDKKK